VCEARGTSFKHPGQRHICSELLMVAENYFETRVCHSRSRHLRHRCVSCPLSAVSIFQAFRLVPRQNYARSQNQRLGGAVPRQNSARSQNQRLGGAVPRQNSARSQNQRLGGAPARRTLRYGSLMFVRCQRLLGWVISVFRARETSSWRTSPFGNNCWL